MKVPSLVRRAGWNLGDQMISSLTNAVLSFLVARSVSAESFGGFSIAFTVFALVIGGSRAISTSPLNMRFADATPEEGKRAAAAAAGNALVLGIVTGAGCVAAGLLLPDSLGQALLALGIVMPALLVQDAYRYVFFSRGRPAMAALNDSVWAVVQIGAVAGLLVWGMDAVGPLLLAWGASAAAAGLLAVRQARAWPAPRRAFVWIREHRDMTGYRLATFATAHGGTQGAILVIGSIGSVVTVGALRGAQILLAPALIMVVAALNFAVPELSRRRARLDDRRWMLAAVGLSGIVALLGFLWGSVFLLAPDAVGAFLLGDTWQGTSDILFAAVIAQAASAAAVGPVIVLYALDRAGSTLLIQVLFGALTFACGVGGVLVDGAIGAQWGFALANAVVVPCWFYQLRRQLRARRTEQPGVLGDPDDTVLLPAVAGQGARFVDDFAVSQMSTMLLPRIEPRIAPLRPPALPHPPRHARPPLGPRPDGGSRVDPPPSGGRHQRDAMPGGDPRPPAPPEHGRDPRTAQPLPPGPPGPQHARRLPPAPQPFPRAHEPAPNRRRPTPHRRGGPDPGRPVNGRVAPPPETPRADPNSNGERVRRSPPSSGQ